MDNTYAVDSHAVIVLVLFKRNTENSLADFFLLNVLMYIVN